MKYIIEVYSDGSCLGNPGPGGWGLFLRKRDHKTHEILNEVEWAGGAEDTTNNRMEMTAILKALELFNHRQISDSVIYVYSDSNLVVSTFTKGWKKKANTDIWQKIDAEFERCKANGNKFNWKWVKAHNGHPENERVDDLARAEATKLANLLD